MSKQVKICLGRFMPFHLGHLKMATYKDLKGPDSEQKDSLREQPNLKEIANQKTIILSILTTKDKVDTRHPFDADLMKDELELLKKNYSSEIEDILYVKSADICAWGEMLKQKGYQASVWLTGSDEFAMYKGMAIKVPEYEEKNRDNRDFKGACTKSFYVEEIERTDDGDFISSISGTKVRQALLNNDKELFTKMMPKGADKYFDKFKEAVENAPEPKKRTTKKKVKEGMRSLKDYIFEKNIKINNMKSIVNYINESKHISDRMFIKALKNHGELSKAELNEIFGDTPFMLDDQYEVDAMYVGRGHLYFSFFNKNNKEVEREITDIEMYDPDDIEKIYNYLTNKKIR